jgi:hypothetical protein
LSAVGKILLLTATAPRPDGVGGIILSDLCALLPHDSACIAYVPERSSAEDRDSVVANELLLRTFPVPYARKQQSHFGRIGRGVRRLLGSFGNRKAIAAARRDIVRWARERDVTQVWAILDSPVTTELADGLARDLGVPLRTTVWDDVHHNNAYYGISGREARRQVERFSDALRHGESCAAIGETMKAEYERLYGARNVTILRHGVDVALSTCVVAAQRSEIMIGFAGSVTARTAFDCLLATLDRLQWQLDGKAIVLRLLGHRFDLRSKVERHIECFGWRSVDDTVRLLSECDVNYLPQAFEADWEPFSRLSFPSKLTTYLATGAPVLLHAPANASLPAFLQRYEFGTWCDSLQSGALEQALRGSLDPARRPGYRQTGNRALAEEFSRATFRSRFARFLGVDESELAA